MTAIVCTVAAVLSCTFGATVSAQSVPGNHNDDTGSTFSDLGGAPSAPAIAPQSTGAPVSAQAAQASLTIDTTNRESVLALYNSEYAASSSMVATWTGSQSACNAGDIPASLREAMLRRINWFRAMAGVPAGVSLNPGYNANAQKMALMISANNQLSHNPPSTWACFNSDGQLAARNSNLILGAGGVESADLYMWDYGSNNTAVGHRRWLLYPQTQEMGMGNVPAAGAYRAANALWVIDSNVWQPRPATRDGFVAWPPPGYVPANTVYPRWSLSYPNADFSRANVSMTSSGAPMAVRLEPVANGYGENTLVWIPNGMSDGGKWPEPASDQQIRVTVSNVLVNGAPVTFDYTVVVIALPKSQPPTGIAATPNAGGVREDAPTGATIGMLTASDPDNSGGHSFALVSGGGDTDNSYFRIDGNQLILVKGLDYETKRQMQLRIRATDPAGASFSQPVSIAVMDVNEPPHLLSSTAMVHEGEFSYTIVAVDPEDGAASVSVLAAPPAISYTAQSESAVLSGDSSAIVDGANTVTLRLTDSVGASSDVVLTLMVARSTLLLPVVTR